MALEGSGERLATLGQKLREQHAKIYDPLGRRLTGATEADYRVWVRLAELCEEERAMIRAHRVRSPYAFCHALFHGLPRTSPDIQKWNQRIAIAAKPAALCDAGQAPPSAVHS